MTIKKIALFYSATIRRVCVEQPSYINVNYRPNGCVVLLSQYETKNFVKNYTYQKLSIFDNFSIV